MLRYVCFENFVYDPQEEKIKMGGTIIGQGIENSAAFCWQPMIDPIDPFYWAAGRPGACRICTKISAWRTKWSTKTVFYWKKRFDHCGTVWQTSVYVLWIFHLLRWFPNWTQITGGCPNVLSTKGIRCSAFFGDQQDMFHQLPIISNLSSPSRR